MPMNPPLAQHSWHPSLQACPCLLATLGLTPLCGAVGMGICMPAWRARGGLHLHPYHPSTSFQPLSTLETPPLKSCPSPGQDEASSLEVTWPDGRVVVRSVASSEINSVLEVPYPLDMEEPLMPALLEVRAQGGAIWGRNWHLGSAGLVAAQG